MCLNMCILRCVQNNNNNVKFKNTTLNVYSGFCGQSIGLFICQIQIWRRNESLRLCPTNVTFLNLTYYTYVMKYNNNNNGNCNRSVAT
jgi:hypothetical protein